MSKTNYLQAVISDLQRTAGPYRCAKTRHAPLPHRRDDAVTLHDGTAIGMCEIPDHYEDAVVIPSRGYPGALAAPSWGEIQCHSTRTYRAVICSLAPPAH